MDLFNLAFEIIMYGAGAVFVFGGLSFLFGTDEKEDK